MSRELRDSTSVQATQSNQRIIRRYGARITTCARTISRIMDGPEHLHGIFLSRPVASPPTSRWFASEGPPKVRSVVSAFPTRPWTCKAGLRNGAQCVYLDLGCLAWTEGSVLLLCGWVFIRRLMPLFLALPYERTGGTKTFSQNSKMKTLTAAIGSGRTLAVVALAVGMCCQSVVAINMTYYSPAKGVDATFGNFVEK